jgi:hypothetical protein
MDDTYRLEAKGLARAKLRARRRRVQTIRRRTLRGSLALFAAIWAVVFGQLISGNDPALSSVPKRAAHRPVAATGPAPEPEPATEAEPALEPEEEVVEVEPEPAPEPEPEPVVTASS